MLSRVVVQAFRNKSQLFLSVSRNFSVVRPMLRSTVKFNAVPKSVQSRGYKNVPPKNSRRPKTKSGIKKRFIATASGALKYGHACKYHLNIKKSSTRLSRLGKKGLLQGTWLAKMNRMIR